MSSSYLGRVWLLMSLFMLPLSPVLLAAQHPSLARKQVLAPRHAVNNTPASLLARRPDVVLVGLKPGALAASDFHPALPASSATPAALALIQAARIEPLFHTSTRSGSLATTATHIRDTAAVYRVHLQPGADVLKAVAALQADPSVAYAEPDYQAQLTATPTDPRYSDQWGLSQINAASAWDVTRGSPDVTIAVIDSGVELSHPDLSGQLWINPGEIAGNGLDDDNNGRIDDIHGWNVLANNADVSDTTGHGTTVAGVISAAANNGQGGAGVCWNCRLMAVKVTQSSGVANYSDIAAGVLYAAQKGAKVINLSLGGLSDSATLRAAIATASETAVIVGGGGNDKSSTAFYPAAYETVLGVTGTNQSDAKVDTANYGSWVDAAAPGVDILTTFSGGGYGLASGTSLAAPFVAGLAGLLRSQHPGWSPAQVRAHIVRTTTNVDAMNPGYQSALGSGRIDAGRALTTPARPELTLASIMVNGQPDGRPEPNTAAELVVTLRNQWANATNIQATLSGPGVTQASASFGNMPAFASSANTTPFRFTASLGYNTPMAFTLTVTADGGYSATLPFTVTTAPGVTNVGATISGNQVWTADRTYLINQDSGLTPGSTLTIQPGTVVRLGPKVSLTIEGTLIADGTAARPIKFTRQNSAGNWGFIKFADSSVDAAYTDGETYTGGSILRHVQVEDGEGIGLQNAAPFIAHSSFSNIGAGGMYAGMAQFAITGSSSGLVVADNTFNNIGLSISPTGTTGITALRNTVHNGTLSATGGGPDTTNVFVGNTITNYSTDRLLTGISTNGTFTIRYNRISGGEVGLNLNIAGGVNPVSREVSANLIENTTSHGATLNLIGSSSPGTIALTHNTIINSTGAGIYITTWVAAPGPTAEVALHDNNLITRGGAHAVRLADSYSLNIDATGNWWGTTDSAAIQAAIYDGNDKYGVGMVDAGNALTDADQEAPAYIQGVATSPDSTLGIQTGTFDVRFSRPMRQDTNPVLGFHDAQRGTWAKMPVPNLSTSMNANALAAGPDGTTWVGTPHGIARFDDGKWTVYTQYGSVSALTVDTNGTVWAGVQGGIVSFDGSSWQRITCPSNTSACNSMDMMTSIAIDRDGSKWVSFNTGPNISGRVARLSGNTWTFYDNTNSALPARNIASVAIDPAGVKWFAANGYGDGAALLSFDGINWTSYSMANSALKSNNLYRVFIDADGSKWLTSEGVLMRFDGSTWSTYTTGNYANLLAVDGRGGKWLSTGQAIVRFDGKSFTPFPNISGMHGLTTSTVDTNGNLWTNVSDNIKGGVYQMKVGRDFTINDNARWLDSRTWRGTYDITSLVPRGPYQFTATRTTGTDGIPAASAVPGTFNVDYAGTISDRTPPSPPSLFATGIPGDVSAVRMTWSSMDAETSINAYRYAIGTSPGATDIVNWTTVSPAALASTGTVSATAIAPTTRTGLGLTAGRQYWVSVQAQNAGGLWSARTDKTFIAGQQAYMYVYLPSTIR